MYFVSPDVANFLTKSFFPPSRKTPHFIAALNPMVDARTAFALERNSPGSSFLTLVTMSLLMQRVVSSYHLHSE